MRTSSLVAAALYAGLTIAQDLTAINNLPNCGVCISSEPAQSIEHRTDLVLEIMHQQHAGQGR